VSVVYAREAALPVDDYVDVVGHSTLGATRPIGDRERVAEMIAGADLIVSARIEGRCVGLARCLTDFAWVAYCGDLAVHEDFQGRGIGLGLLAACRDILGEQVGMALLSAPGAVGFYDAQGPKVDLHPLPGAYFMTRRRGI
jgi:GNAT superfamily N-acetyltransferase